MSLLSFNMSEVTRLFVHVHRISAIFSIDLFREYLFRKNTSYWDVPIYCACVFFPLPSTEEFILGYSVDFVFNILFNYSSRLPLRIVPVIHQLI